MEPPFLHPYCLAIIQPIRCALTSKPWAGTFNQYLCYYVEVYIPKWQEFWPRNSHFYIVIAEKTS